MIALRHQDNQSSTLAFDNLHDSVDAYEVVLTEHPVRKKKSWRTIGEIRFVSVQKKWNPCYGKILIYLKANDCSTVLQAGSKIIIHKKWEKLDTISFIPKGYKQFLHRQGIYHRVFISQREIKLMGREDPSWLRRTIASMQSRTLETLRKNIVDKNALALAEALLIGYREDLDAVFKEIYTRAGIVHVIAISGMHLGLLYLVLLWLLNKIPLINKSHTAKAIVCIFFLWIFSFLCGATASVLRSAVMFSYLIVGKLLGRNGQVYNALAVSALILLTIDPYILWDVGFQLSYTAILGIVILQKPVFGMLEIKQFLFRKIWELMSVTIAAQIMTLPLCLYYFHQFPNYFLLSNLVAIPLSTLILFGEVIVLLFSPLPFLAEKTGKIIEWLINVFHCLMKSISEWPGAVTVDIHFNAVALIFLYVSVAIIWWFVKNAPTMRSSH
jgi:competence protein ComEC